LIARLHESYARRVSEAAATMPSFTAARAWTPCPPAELVARLEGDVLRVAWRDGARVHADAPRIAVALPGPVFPVLGDYHDLRARDPESLTAAELAGATFTVWGLDLELDWLTPPSLPRQGAGLGVGRAGLVLVCDARAVDPADADALLSAATERSASARGPS
jgi:hypothetical protein